MKKILFVLLAMAAIFVGCSTDDTSTSTNLPTQKSESVDPVLVPEIGDQVEVNIVLENDPKFEVQGTVTVTILCKTITYQSVHGDDWAGIGKDADGNYWIIHSTVDLSIGSNGKPVYTRHTTGYMYTGGGVPGYPC